MSNSSRKKSDMKKNSIRKTLPRMIWSMVLCLMFLILPANIILQFHLQHQNQKESSLEVFGQLRQLLEINERDLENAKEEFKEKCIQSAEMAAYFVEYTPSVTSDYEQTLELAEKLNVDEIHYFTPKGEIYFGTHPEYYGYTFYSGEQMAFFLPMLEDKNLQLCQDIVPNTAEGKEMQYAAVWMKDGSGIVQIGMEPRRLMHEIDERSMDKLIEKLPLDNRGYVHVLDREKEEIVASTSRKLIGYDVSEEYEKYKGKTFPNDFHYKFRDNTYCVHTQEYGEYTLIRTYLSYYPRKAMMVSTILVLIYIGFVGGIVLSLVVWYANRKLSNNLTKIVAELEKVENGNLENIALRTGINEFDDLLFYINQLLKSVRLNWDKLSYVIDKGRLPIGIFEYNSFYKKTFISERLLSILGMEEIEQYSTDVAAELVLKKLEAAEAEITNPDNPVCEYEKNGEKTYLRIEKVIDEYSVTYYVTDVSMWWAEIHVLKEQSNRDLLTGLYNLRGFSERMNQLFAEPQQIGYGVMVFLDADGLKKINDLYGHQYGDRYLRKITEIILECSGEDAVCARLGGDEFAVFLYHYASYQEVEQAGELFKEKRGKIFALEDKEELETLEFSLGYAFYPMDGNDYHLLMHIADENMYQEKRKRKFREGV